MDVRNPKPINKETMGCDCDEVQKHAKCPGCEYEFMVKPDLSEKECPNCEQVFDIDEYINYYNESH